MFCGLPAGPTGSFREGPPVPEIEVNEPEISPTSTLRSNDRTHTGKSNMSSARAEKTPGCHEEDHGA